MFIDLRERGREEGKKNINVREKYQLLAPCMQPKWDGTCHLGMCPDWELNLQPFVIQGYAPTS